MKQARARDRKAVSVRITEPDEMFFDSDKLLRAIFEGSTDAFFVKDLRGRYRIINSAGGRLIGQSVESVIGKDDTEFFSPETARALMERDRHIMTVGETETFEEATIAGGITRAYLTTKSAYRDHDGCIIGLIGIARDITERKRMEQELERLAKDRLLLLESTWEGIYGLDIQGRCTFINRAATAMLGYVREELLGKMMHSIHHHSRPDGSPYPVEDCPIYHAFKSGQGCRIEDEIFWRRDGSSFAVEVSSYPIKEDGQVKGAVVVFNDISARKRAEEELQNREELLWQLMVEREHLAQDLHDDIIQKIYAIGLNLESSKHRLEKDSRVAAVSLEQPIEDLNGVIKDVRNCISGLDTGAVNAARLRAELAKLVQDRQDGQLPRFRLKLDPVAVSRLSAEQAKEVLFIVREALSNSLRHSKAKTGFVSLRIKQGCLRLEISDDGIGFECPQGESSGHGLRNMAARTQKLGGRLDVVSVPGQGTRIILDILKE